MNDKRYTLILYVIVFVILGTISIQVYWNYKNYLTNKQQLINDVQVSLDNAVETYYADLAEQNTVAFAFEGSADAFFDRSNKFDSLLHTINFSSKRFKDLDSINVKLIDGISIYSGTKADSTIGVFKETHDLTPHNRQAVIKRFRNSKTDSLLHDNFKMLTSKVMLSMTNDTLRLKDIVTLLITELNRKNLSFEYGLSFKNLIDGFQFINKERIDNSSLSTISKSPYLPEESNLTIHFTNEIKIILSRILSGILLSTLLVLAVISCLFYLLKIIKHQKQLAEVKNDLISNITHEFKTPIATISVALESIKNFDVIDDKDKTKTYLDMSSGQLSKLNVMVEKLLETATLDSENLNLNKEDINLVDLLQTITEKYSMTLDGKTLEFKPSSEIINIKVDIFHFENAISNIIDNAIKYGGNSITLNLSKNSKDIEVNIIDNGNTLTKSNLSRIFEKFYRVPKGNTHDVKGFGIGLYYTKKIIEKHNGSIQVLLNNNATNFKIKLPNE